MPGRRGWILVERALIARSSAHYSRLVRVLPMNGGTVRACRGMLTVSIAVVGLVLFLAAGAHARTETFRVGLTADVDGRGSVSGTYTCQPANQPISDCPPSWTLHLERAGQVIGAATGRGFDTVGVGHRPQAGDVVRFLRAGIDDVVWTYDGLPAFDDTSCTMIGQRALSGTVASWHPTFSLVWISPLPSPPSISRAGDRFQASIVQPLARGTVVMAISEGTQALSPSQALTVRSQTFARICGLPADAPAYEVNVTGPTKKIRLRVGRDGRFTLKRNRLECPAGVAHCTVLVATHRKTRQGLREAGTLRYTVRADSRRRLKGKLTRRATKRLARTGRTDVIVRVIAGLPPGDHQIKGKPSATLLATLLAP
jgi:hypothetical protein